MDIAEWPYCQIQSMTRGIQVANRGRDANAVAAIARPRSNPGRSRIVMVRHIGIAEVPPGLVKGAIDRLPVIGARPFDPDGTGGAVKVALRVAIVFKLAIIRQDLW